MQIKSYPPTRYMGSKEKILPYIKDIISPLNIDSVLDLFSGSGVVSYLFKTMGKKVITNDYMTMNYISSKAMIENDKYTLSNKEIEYLFEDNENVDTFVQDTFQGLYYSDDDNALIDRIRSNILHISNPYKQAIAMSSLIRACVKKRARGIFTYTGLRYDDGRADLRLSMQEQVYKAIELTNNAVFDNGEKNKSRHGDAIGYKTKVDLVYIDPPYYSPLSDNEYVRRYHFVEGLSRNWDGVDIQWETKTKKFKNYSTPFSTMNGTKNAFEELFRTWKNSVILVSYSSNSLPNKNDLIAMMKKYKQNVEIIEIDYKYSFANKKNVAKNDVQEYLFMGY